MDGDVRRPGTRRQPAGTKVQRHPSGRSAELVHGRLCGRARRHIHGDLDVQSEPFTLREIGSAQVFQTGETYQHLPLIDYQHRTTW